MARVLKFPILKIALLKNLAEFMAQTGFVEWVLIAKNDKGELTFVSNDTLPEERALYLLELAKLRMLIQKK